MLFRLSKSIWRNSGLNTLKMMRAISISHKHTWNVISPNILKYPLRGNSDKDKTSLGKLGKQLDAEIKYELENYEEFPDKEVKIETNP